MSWNPKTWTDWFWNWVMHTQPNSTLQQYLVGKTFHLEPYIAQYGAPGRTFYMNWNKDPGNEYRIPDRIYNAGLPGVAGLENQAVASGWHRLERMYTYNGMYFFDFGVKNWRNNWNNLFYHPATNISLYEVYPGQGQDAFGGNNHIYMAEIRMNGFPAVDQSLTPLVQSWWSSMTPENKISHGVTCCTRLNQLDSETRNICNMSPYTITNQGPTQGCDQVMSEYCSDKTGESTMVEVKDENGNPVLDEEGTPVMEEKIVGDPLCGCAQLAPYDDTTSEAQLYKYYTEKPDSNMNWADLKPCLLPECNNNIAYKWSNMYNKNCPQICAIINNMNVGDYANLDASDINFNMSCGGEQVHVKNVPCKIPDLDNGQVMCASSQDGYATAGSSCDIIPDDGYECSTNSITCNSGTFDNIPICTALPEDPVDPTPVPVDPIPGPVDPIPDPVDPQSGMNIVSVIVPGVILLILIGVAVYFFFFRGKKKVGEGDVEPPSYDEAVEQLKSDEGVEDVVAAFRF